ncbi:MAG: imidazole glycerol phosphate synthase subunit HisH [Clostridia bacterium]|nr:imidazole glycerol phosphate synthase subunit HisH [Clostridia bacterium]
MIAIIDYGVGNLFSLCSSLNSIGAEAIVTPDPDAIRRADRIILPGVGAFADAAEKLRASGLDQVLLEEAARGKPVMGICLGMQMLFEESHEYGIHKGLGLIPGRVIPMAGYIPADLKVPHIGWNPLIIKGDKHPLLRYVEEGDCVYFVHSYFATDCTDAVIATAEYGRELTAAVACGNVMGCQFHPEKSGKVGLSILKAFCEM